MTCAAIRQRRLDACSQEERNTIAERLLKQKLMDASIPISELRRVRLTILGANTTIDVERQKRRLRYHPPDREPPADLRGRPREWWDARDPDRIDAQNWKADVLGRPRGRFLPLDVPIRIQVIEECAENGCSTHAPVQSVISVTARLVVHDRCKGGPLVLFECPVVGAAAGTSTPATGDRCSCAAASA